MNSYEISDIEESILKDMAAAIELEEQYQAKLQKLAQDIYINKNVSVSMAYKWAADFIAHQHNEDMNGKTVVNGILVKYYSETSKLDSSGLMGMQTAITVWSPDFPNSFKEKRIVGSDKVTAVAKMQVYVLEQLNELLMSSNKVAGKINFFVQE